MSEEAVASIPSQDELVAILESADKPAQEPEAPAAAAPEPAPQAQGAADAPPPAPAAEAPKPVELADSTVVVDPADGQTKTWGEVKAERLRQADYTRKTQAVAEERRAIVAERERLQAEARKLAAEFQQIAAVKRNAGNQLPDDDPYVQNMNALSAQLQAQQAKMESLALELRQKDEQAALAASRAALESKRAEVSSKHGFTPKEISLVEAEYWTRKKQGEPVTYDQVADDLKKLVDEIGNRKLEEWKNKNRTAPDTIAPSAAPASGSAPPPVNMRSESFINMIKGLL